MGNGLPQETMKPALFVPVFRRYSDRNREQRKPTQRGSGGVRRCAGQRQAPHREESGHEDFWGDCAVRGMV